MFFVGFMVSFDIRSIIFGIAAIGIFIVTASVTVVLMKGRRNSSMYYINCIHVVFSTERNTNNEKKRYFNVFEINCNTHLVDDLISHVFDG